ncbi:endonuclease III domain-containing protein [Desulfocapsa sp. AH-315-G09]|uniref:Endonuclease III domain-containing protein n=1 Tax=Desulfotalea psychrophila TaxID=84980 RepID=A0ABS3AVU2_9BACT|nr:endonuclease III domain-containing protein [Desulfocapsa sp.]MBN4058669.1 endonuclease III domain-containing protein [Desulfocapsa sp. AH-315-J15]MBN4065601.1 endonuclease III domain-containing protein [Desulfocapsa sp. AH-315-G09]MBN4068869.1 endonuclease III domain-containing protein [Desulfotalea psychrophila]
MQQENNNLFLRVYDRLLAHYGPQEWWPGETDFEVMVGAVLTQNTNWINVEKAIANLKNGGQLSFSSLHRMDTDVLAEYIRPAGYYNIKARRLKNLLQMVVDEYEGELAFLFADSLDDSRKNLLQVKGVGPETADAILLYAARKPIFVVDTYTHRVFSRHGLVEEDTDYYSLQQEFLDSLPEEVSLFNEYHALIVAVAKEFCKKKKPRCNNCPLQRVEES